MQEKVKILSELKEAEASTLLQAGNKNYYYLPDGYFNDFVGVIKAD